MDLLFKKYYLNKYNIRIKIYNFSKIKYKNLKCLIINEKELRQELRNKNEKIENLMKSFALDQKISNLKKYFIQNNIIFDAVCTKKPSYWI